MREYCRPHTSTRKENIRQSQKKSQRSIQVAKLQCSSQVFGLQTAFCQICTGLKTRQVRRHGSEERWWRANSAGPLQMSLARNVCVGQAKQSATPTRIRQFDALGLIGFAVSSEHSSVASAPLEIGLTVSFHQVSGPDVGTRRQAGWTAAAADLNQPLPSADPRQGPCNATWFARYVSGWYSHT